MSLPTDYLQQCDAEEKTARPCKHCGAMLMQGQRMSLREYRKATRDTRAQFASNHAPQCKLVLAFEHN